MIYFRKGNTATIFLLLIWSHVCYSQTVSGENRGFLSKLEVSLEIGVSKYDMISDIPSSSLNDNLFNLMKWRIDLDRNSIYGGLLIRKVISPSKQISLESGLTYRKRGSSIEGPYGFLSHNIQIPMVFILDSAPEKKYSLLVKAGLIGLFSIIQEGDEILALSGTRKLDYGYQMGLGCKMPIAKLNFEVWSQLGSGSFYKRNYRFSPGGFRYDFKERNRFFEFGVLLKLK